MRFGKVVDSAVYFWAPGLPADLPPILELVGAAAHSPARGGILSDACIGYVVDEMT